MDELSVQSSELSVLSHGAGIADVIKPLVREIHLFDTFVAGVSVLRNRDVLEKLKTGQKLTLRREKSKFDDCAIAIFTEEGERVGTVPEKDSIIFSRLMDAGKLLTAHITDIQMRSVDYQLISIGIYLTDF